MKTAVILFNLGGPDRPEAIRPFLFNLFNDPAIIRLPWILRRLLAGVISRRRAKVAAEIYAKLGGRSPILPETEAQAAALEKALAEAENAKGSGDYWRVFIAMRYWHPFAAETVRQVREWGAERVLLLPLYPQFSTTTTESSIKDWRRAAKTAGLAVPEAAIGCYAQEAGLGEAQALKIAPLLEQAAAQAGGLENVRLLFSAHGLPKKIVAAGDPYQWQVERSAKLAAEALAARNPAWAKLDWQVCYQSRVGPLEWIGPSTDSEIQRAGREKKAVVLVPIAFVSEHSETLVELDIEYAHLASEAGVPVYKRVPTLGIEPGFIRLLAGLCLKARFDGQVHAASDAARCPPDFKHCACRA